MTRGWTMRSLSELATDLQPGFACRPSVTGDEISQLRPLNMTVEGTLTLQGTKGVAASEGQRAKYRLEPFDVLFNNTNSPELVGKVVLFDEPGEFVFSNHLTRIRVNRQLLLPRFLQRYLFLLWTEGYFQRLCTQWVNQAAINVDALGVLQIPTPPLSEQRRIVRLLDAAEELRRLRERADRRTADLVPALFHEMFGDSASNPKKWPTKQLGEVVELISGGTPSKDRPEFWQGTIPWVSPKDMKSSEIMDAEDHVTQQAFKETTLKLIPTNSVLIVVRGMILAHTIPIRINRVPVAINQDMKALKPIHSLRPEFLQWVLQAQHAALLTKVRRLSRCPNLPERHSSFGIACRCWRRRHPLGGGAMSRALDANTASAQPRHRTRALSQSRFLKQRVMSALAQTHHDLLRRDRDATRRIDELPEQLVGTGLGEPFQPFSQATIQQIRYHRQREIEVHVQPHITA